MFLIQDGHHMRPHIEPAIKRGHAAGAILSPADLAPAALAETAQMVLREGGILAIDPQVVALGVVDANPKKLLQHGHVESVGLRARDLDAESIRQVVERSLAFQREAGSTVLLSPTVAVASLDERWAQVAQDLAISSEENWRSAGDESPLFVSVAVRDSLLGSRADVDDLLDELTRYSVPGFYLNVEVDLSRDLAAASRAASGALRLVYGLAVEAGYRVWVGYSGASGQIFRAVGAEATSAGWFHKQQWWSPSHWEQGSGGQAPPPRVQLAAMFGSFRWEPDLSRLLGLRRVESSLVSAVLSGPGEISARLATANSLPPTSPDRQALVAQLLAVFSAADQEVGEPGADAITYVRAKLQGTAGLVERLTARGASFDNVRGGPNLTQVFTAALDSFRDT